MKTTLNLKIDDELKKKFKLYCVENEQEMTEVIIKMIENKLKVKK